MSTGPPASSVSLWQPVKLTRRRANVNTSYASNELVAKGRLALPRPDGHDVLSVARLLIPPLGHWDD